MKRTTHLSLGLLLLAALPLPALAATPISVWHSYRGKEAEALQKLAEGFNAKNKDIEIKLLQIPYDAFADKVTASIPGERGPTSSSSPRTASGIGRPAVRSRPSTSGSMTG